MGEMKRKAKKRRTINPRSSELWRNPKDHRSWSGCAALE
jgi:hypothetical protein